MSINIGFTGTRQGMTARQKRVLHNSLTLMGNQAGEFHHGDCVGADKEAHDIAYELGLHIIVHPPTNDKHRAFTTGGEMREPKGYIDRNHDIVDETDHLFAAPLTVDEVLRSGTWSTVRYARRLGKRNSIMEP